MATWKTASTLSARYAVAEHRLSDHASRGHLPVRRGGPDGPLFDEDTVALLFPLRSGSVTQHLGLLGTLRLAFPTCGSGADPSIVPGSEVDPLTLPRPDPATPLTLVAPALRLAALDPRAERRHTARLSGLRVQPAAPAASAPAAPTSSLAATGSDPR